MPFTRFIVARHALRAARGLALHRAAREARRRSSAIRSTSCGRARTRSPESDAVLQTLKRLLNEMFPPGGALSILERQKIAERDRQGDLHPLAHGRGELRRRARHEVLRRRAARQDGSNIPTCSYNVLYRERDARFADPTACSQRMAEHARRVCADEGDRCEAARRSITPFTRTPDAAHARGLPLVLEGACARPAARWSTACASSATARSTCASSARAHGPSEALISGDADWFLRSLTYIKEGSVPLKHSTKVEEGCPNDCGLCPDHEQHSCLPIIEITNHCNLECPICIVQNRHNYNMTRGGVRRHHRRARREGRAARHDQPLGRRADAAPAVPRVPRHGARAPEISRVSISTNGLRIATDYAFCQRARAAQGVREPAARRAAQSRAARAPRRRRSSRRQGAGARQPGARRRADDDRRRRSPRASTTTRSATASACSSSATSSCR